MNLWPTREVLFTEGFDQERVLEQVDRIVFAASGCLLGVKMAVSKPVEIRPGETLVAAWDLNNACLLLAPGPIAIALVITTTGIKIGSFAQPSPGRPGIGMHQTLTLDNLADLVGKIKDEVVKSMQPFPYL